MKGIPWVRWFHNFLPKSLLSNIYFKIFHVKRLRYNLCLVPNIWQMDPDIICVQHNSLKPVQTCSGLFRPVQTCSNQLKPVQTSKKPAFQLFKNIQHSNFTQLVSRLCRTDSVPLRKNETFISFKVGDNDDNDVADVWRRRQFFCAVNGSWVLTLHSYGTFEKKMAIFVVRVIVGGSFLRY